MRSIWIWVIVLIIIIGGGLMWWKMSNTTDDSMATTTPETTTNDTASGTTLANSDAAAVITYTDSGFSPANVTIKKGETVQWVNNSSRAFWPASAQHPTHTVYDGTSLSQHCDTTDAAPFDACHGINQGETYEFTFDKTGEWAYHDHLNASKFGKVTVTE